MITVPWEEDRPPPDASPERSRHYGILVVDDDKGSRAVLNVWLKHLGYRVWMAANGLDAIDLYKRHRDAISVVLMDVNMPAMGGRQTLDAIRQLNPQVCCCILSGKRDGFSEMGLREMGTETLLRKPFRLMELEQLLWETRRADPLSDRLAR